jgi:hypothetical protein
MPGCRASTDEHTGHVDGYDGIPVVQGHVERRLTTIYARVVKENVDTTVSTCNVGERPFDRLRIRHVHGERMTSDPDFLGDLSGRGLTRVEYDNPRACRCECKRDGPPYAAAAASHDGNFAIQQEIREVKQACFPLFDRSRTSSIYDL